MRQQILTVLLLTLLNIIALFLFCNGFLLTRISLDDVSETGSHPKTPTFTKAVILVIDALRYDFTKPQINSSAFWNQLPILAHHVDNFPDNAYLSKFIADPPTTTLQRLKGLTTGSLPTFIDASSNFGGEAITEDNLILQLRKAGKRIAFAGDDTWQALFPDSFEKELNFPFESLNVWDLDTVDNGVYHHLFVDTKAFFSEHTRSKWDVVIAHALGLDHAGHRYGPDHEETTRKLREMDSWIKEIISAIDNDTLLVVMGDHGMNPYGDHGGDSPEELEAALFMYSKKAIFTKSPSDDYGSEGVAQIDLVPTFALLMGLPIPFNNLGSPIPSAFAKNSALSYESAMALCTEQIRKYVFVYERHSSSIKQLLNSFDGGSDTQSRRSVTWHRNVLEVFRQQWAQYHMPSIRYSLSFMASTIVFEIGLYNAQHSSMLLDVVSCVLAIQSTFFFYALKNLISHQVRWLGICSGLLIFILYVLVRPSKVSSSSNHGKARDYRSLNGPDIASLMALILHFGTFASNSFTIHEDRISLFFLGLTLSPVLITIFTGPDNSSTSQQKLRNVIPVVGIMGLSRFAASIRFCREEQGSACDSNFHSFSASITFPLMLALGFVVSQTYQACFTLNSRSVPASRRWVYFTTDLIFLLSAIHWFMDYLELADPKLLVARTLLTLVCLAPFAWYRIPLPVSFKVVSRQLVIDGADQVSNRSYLQLIMAPVSSLVFLSRGVGSISMLCLLLSLLLSRSPAITQITSHSRIFSIVLPFELACLHFFATGHQMALPFIQWDLAFLASRSIIYPLSPLLVIGNAFASFFVVALLIPVLALWSTGRAHDKTHGQGGNHSDAGEDKSVVVTKAMVGYMTLHSAITFSTMIFATHFRRHLMVWKIFAPRFMCAALIMLCTDATLLIASLGLALSRYKIKELVKTIQGVLPDEKTTRQG